MPDQPIAAAVRHCKFCSAELVRKHSPSGRIEPDRNYVVRQFCDSRCYGDYMMAANKTPSAQAGRKRAQKLYTVRQCGDCGTTEGRLHRHHLDRDPTNNAPGNVVILCASCHIRLHYREGDQDRRIAAMRGSKPPWLTGGNLNRDPTTGRYIGGTPDLSVL